jgi:hydrogenase maturation protein HypF
MSRTGNSTTNPTRIVISVTGVVQGVGFRPFIYRQATSRGLAGRVINTAAGVEIDVEGAADAVASLVEDIRTEAPPRALITSVETVVMEPAGRSRFEIGTSLSGRSRRQLVSPDSCTCDACQRELFDPDNRRYRYPFINCTDCGPRFTIMEGLPYDRSLTTMSAFEMCPDCLAEYEDPANRRFHAEPNACPHCGPSLWLAGRDGAALPAVDPVQAAAAALLAGKIVALKGLGGFQLACLASDKKAVGRLRQLKQRPHKPFAVMAASADEAGLLCLVSEAEKALLESVERPIVLLRTRTASHVGGVAAPGLDHLGVMLPYTPLHFLLMDAVGEPLIMTSGNRFSEPICRTNNEAVERLGPVADLLLLHNRGIRSTYDDSVAMIGPGGRTVLLRRARGYAPMPVMLPLGDEMEHEPVLAGGGELKSAFCLTRGKQAFLSQHIGDLGNAATLEHYERTEKLFEEIFGARPRRLACDLHPGYLSTSYCLDRGEPVTRFQHHRAHMAACLAENGFTGAAVGMALDGTGLGDDGAIWGGEFFTGSLAGGLKRAAHLQYFPLLGGEAAIREPWRTALALAWTHAPADVDLVADIIGIDAAKKRLLLRQLGGRLNCPATSSCGRLFDAVASLALGRNTVTYEAQGAMELEAAARRWLAKNAESLPHPAPYRFEIAADAGPWLLSPGNAVRSIMSDLGRGEAPGAIAARFHQGLAAALVDLAAGLAERDGLDTAALSGGVFQNLLLLELVSSGLARRGLKVLSHGMVPPNDGGLALGQAALLLCRGSYPKES